MSDKKGKGINLSGLSKGGQSNSFLSFRFSPESEEIQQIVQDTPGDNRKIFSNYFMTVIRCKNFETLILFRSRTIRVSPTFS